MKASFENALGSRTSVTASSVSAKSSSRKLLRQLLASATSAPSPMAPSSNVSEAHRREELACRPRRWRQDAIVCDSTRTADVERRQILTVEEEAMDEQSSIVE